MAALGAGAGAFQGDMEREAAAARRAQLGLQAQRMNQDAQQFYEKTKLDRELMASEEAENAAKRQENADALALRQKNTDRQFALDEKKFQAGRENDAYLRGRDERKDAWSEALNTQELENRSLEARKLNAEYAEMQRLRKQGEEARANKTRLVESAAGLIIRSGIENGAASPEELAVFSKAIGKQTDMAYPAGDGSFVIRTVEGVDKQTGQPIFKERLLDPTVVAAVMEKFQDPMDPRKPNVPTTDAALFRQQSLEQRESMKYENEKNIASLRGQRAPRFDAQQLEAVKDDILDLESALNAKGLAPEKKAQLEAELKEAKAFKRSLIYSGIPSAGDAQQSPGGQGGGALSGYTEQQMNELGGLKVQALREANGDDAKALDIFKQKKKQWESSHVNPDGSAATPQQAQPAELKPIQEPDMTTSRFARLDDEVQRRTGVYDTNGSTFGRNHDFGSSSGNAPSSASSTLIKNEPNTDLSPEDKEAMTEIFYESQKNPIDPVTSLPIDPVEYRRMKEAEYFQAKRDGDQKQMKELFDDPAKPGTATPAQGGSGDPAGKFGGAASGAASGAAGERTAAQKAAGTSGGGTENPEEKKKKKKKNDDESGGGEGGGGGGGGGGE